MSAGSYAVATSHADDSLNQLVGSVFEAVAERGDAAVADFTRQFDSVSLDEIEATSAEFRQARTTRDSE